jgi:hypothetical protein
MRILKILFDFYLDASIHVAFAVLSFFKVTLINFNIPVTKNLDFVIFLSTIIMYNFIKYGSRAKSYLIVKAKYERMIQIFSFITGIILLYFLLDLSLLNFILLGTLALLSVLYILPFSNTGMNLRSFSMVKVYLVALVWSICTVLLPLADYWYLVESDVWITFIQRFLFVIVLILPFEIRDMHTDPPSLQTIPRRIGIKNTKRLGYLLLVFIIFLELLKKDLLLVQLSVLLVLLVFTGLLLRYARKEQSSYYTKFLVESIPVFFWLLTAGLVRLL